MVNQVPDDRPPLSLGQRRLWFLDQLTVGNIAYNSPAAYRIRGPLDTGALAGAMAHVVDRHDVLRTRYAVTGGEPYPVIGKPDGFELVVTDVATADDPVEGATELIRADIETPFALDRGKLLRARLLRLAEEDHILAIVVHHSVFDGASFGIWASEVTTAYAALRDGTEPVLPDLPAQYADYARWQREELTDDLIRRQVDYWRTTLADASLVLELPADHPRPAQPSHRAGIVDFEISPAAAELLGKQAAAAGVSLFMVTLAAYQALLARYTGSADIVVGCPVDGRSRVAFHGLIGFFVNSLPIRARLAGDPPFTNVVQQARWAILDALSRMDVPFERIVEELAPPRDLSRNPLFQVWFDLAVQPPDGETGLPVLVGAEVSRFDARSARSRFDMELHLAARPGGRLTGRLQYATDLFLPATANRFVEHYRNFLHAVAAEPGTYLSEVPIFGPEELHTIVERWGAAP
jgi:hypothetical protein